MHTSVVDVVVCSYRAHTKTKCVTVKVRVCSSELLFVLHSILYKRKCKCTCRGHFYVACSLVGMQWGSVQFPVTAHLVFKDIPQGNTPSSGKGCSCRAATHGQLGTFGQAQGVHGCDQEYITTLDATDGGFRHLCQWL